jgi:hypothetical protein
MRFVMNFPCVCHMGAQVTEDIVTILGGDYNGESRVLRAATQHKG